MGARVASEIKALAKEKWSSSGISDATAKKLGLRALTGAEVAKLAPNFHPVGSLLIPYFDLKGKPTKFYRIRYLEELPGFAGQVEKPQRYSQPADTINEVYYPPILKKSWHEVAADPKVSVYITEGELKAACACAHGLPTLGLGGVDVWRAKKRGIDILPSLEEFEWKGRVVTIVYDSDAATNPNVVRAQRVLARELLGRGALPSIAALPPTTDGKKQGLDDYLVANGVESLQAVLRSAPLFHEAEALWSLNEEVVYVRNPGIIVVRDTGQRLDPGGFAAHAYANRHYMEASTTKEGLTVLKKKPLAKRWIEWESRFEVEKVIYEPGKPRLYNGGWNVWPGWGVQPKAGSVDLWHRLLDHLFKGEPDARAWFEKWCAYPLQHPGTKLYTAAVIWSVQKGVGKSLALYLLKAIYGPNAIEIKSKDLKGGFNAWAEHKQFVIGDEITGGQARVDADWLKGQITQPFVRINAKFMPEVVLRDCINYGLTSNHPDTIFMEDGDRRYFVHEVVNGPAARSFYEECDRWLHGEGPANLFDYLLKLDLKGFNPREHAPVTTAKQNMIYSGKSDLGVWCVQLREDPAAALRPLGEEVAKGDLFTPSQLLSAYDPSGNKRVTANGVARELLRSGFRQVNGGSPVRTRVGVIRLYAIRNPEKWLTASPKEIAAHFEKYAEARRY